MSALTRDNKNESDSSRLWTRVLVLVMTAFLAFIYLNEMRSLPRQLPPAWSADARYVAQAEHLRAGAWLGPFSASTLIDRPGLPLFLARAADLGLGERYGSALLHLAGCLLGATLLVRLRLDARLALAAFALALFQPVLMGALGQRLAPEKLHADLALILVTGLLHVGLTRRPLARLLGLAPLGLVLALDVLTVSDWRRLLPMIAGCILLAYFLDRRRGASLRTASLRLGLAVVIASLPALVAVAQVEALNAKHHGLGLLSDEQEPEFEAALGALQRIARAQPSASLERPLRRKLYEVAPSFAKLEPALESDLFSGPTGPEDDHGRPAALLRPTIREATARIGAYASADRARDFYRQLARELNDAVASGAVNGLEQELSTDDRAFPLASFGLFWDRLSELWNLQFEDVLPGDAFARVEIDAGAEERAQAVLGDGDERDAGLEQRALAREGRLLLYRRILPGLVILAFVGTLMSFIGRRGEALDRLLLAELVLIMGALAYLLLLCGREAGWYIDRGRAFLPLHLLLPFWLAFGLGHHLRAAAAMIDRKGKARALLALMLILGLGLAVVVARPAHAAERKSRPLFVGSDFIAVGEGGVELAYPGKVLFRISDAADAELRLRPRRDGGTPGPRLLVFEAELPIESPGSSFVVSWEGPTVDERGKQERQLFVRSRESRQRWTIAIEGRRLGDLAIRSPERPELLIRPISLGFAPLDRPFVPGPDPLPEVRAFREKLGLLTIEVRGGERESRYEFFCSGGISAEPRVYPERSGALMLEDTLGLHDLEGNDLRIKVVTDADGNGQVEAHMPTRDPLPERLFIQGLGTQHFTAAPIEVENRY